MIIFLYFSVPLWITLSSIPIDSKSACLTPNSKNTFLQEPGLSLSSNVGGAITNVPPSNCRASIAETKVFPKPTTSEINTPPYSLNFILASITASF